MYGFLIDHDRSMTGAEKDHSTENPTSAPRPTEIDTPAKFTSMLRRLRTWSGLTYRQVEARATKSGDALPSSTIATTLGRSTLPKEQFVAAFTRACGLDDDEVRHWLDVRTRLAINGHPPPGGDSRTENDHPAPTITRFAEEQHVPTKPPRHPRMSRPRRWWRHSIGLALGAGLGVLGTVSASDLPPNPNRKSTESGSDQISDLPIPSVGSWALIRPESAPHLCLAPGPDADGRPTATVAVQPACAGATPSLSYIDPIEDNHAQIQWHRPEAGIYCLTSHLADLPKQSPRLTEDCDDEDPAQLFRFERGSDLNSAGVRIRNVVTNRCLTVRTQRASKTEISQARCSGEGDQEFLVHTVAPGSNQQQVMR